MIIKTCDNITKLAWITQIIDMFDTYHAPADHPAGTAPIAYTATALSAW